MVPSSIPLDPEARAALALLRVAGIGHARLRALRGAFGGAVEALDAPALEFSTAIGVHVDDAARMQRSAKAEDLADESRQLERLNCRAVLEGSAGYPDLLLASHDPPPLLFVRGVLDAAPEPAVAIVGSRRATPYGRLHAGRLAAELAERGVAIVSGGARGIDAEAHRGALRARGRTIAVLATGCTHPYPADHAPLFDAIVEAGGCTITEQPAGVSARPDLFPRRNRIIAALSLVTVVVEAASRSGVLLTARIAVDDLSREAGCVPGPIDSPMSEGCHRAIREGWAQLVTSADDVCELIEQSKTVARGAHELAQRVTRKAPTRPHLSTRRSAHTGSIPAREFAVRSEPSLDGRAALEVIRSEKCAGLDELEVILGWSVQRLACATLELQVSGWIARGTDGGFCAVGS